MTETHDPEMPEEIDFSRGARGQFHRPSMRMHLPIYLDEEIQARLTRLASAKGVEVSDLVNTLLRKDIELIETSI